MVSWVKAFTSAGKIFLLSIAWYIMGIGISVGLMWIMGDLTILSALSSPTILLSSVNFFRLLGEFIAGTLIAAIIGATIAGLGVIATFLKYSVELIRDEVAISDSTPTPPVHVASVQYQSLTVCQTCGTQNVTSAEYCSECGNRLPPRPSI